MRLGGLFSAEAARSRTRQEEQEQEQEQVRLAGIFSAEAAWSRRREQKKRMLRTGEALASSVEIGSFPGMCVHSSFLSQMCTTNSFIKAVSSSCANFYCFV